MFVHLLFCPALHAILILSRSTPKSLTHQEHFHLGQGVSNTILECRVVSIRYPCRARKGVCMKVRFSPRSYSCYCLQFCSCTPFVGCKCLNYISYRMEFAIWMATINCNMSWFKIKIPCRVLLMQYVVWCTASVGCVSTELENGMLTML